jgi:hypothetical protein
MLAEVEDGRLVGVRGDPDNPDSCGFCVFAVRPRTRSSATRAGCWRAHTRAARRCVRRASWDERWISSPRGCVRRGAKAVGTWVGHGLFTSNYGTRVGSHLVRRFANLYGCQWWNPTMICWGLGAFGLGLTGILETNTKEDSGRALGVDSLTGGANLASQPNHARHLVAARRRGAPSSRLTCGRPKRRCNPMRPW